MNTFTVKLGLSGLSAENLVNKGRFVVEQMTGNPNFTTPTPTLAAVTTAIDALDAANGAVLNRGKSEFQARRMAYLAVTLLLQQLAGYVQQTAAGDEDKILSSGFEVRKRSKPIGELSPPQAVAAKPTDLSGRVAIDWDRVHGADVYNVYMSTSSSPFAWELIGVTTKSRFNADNLTPLTFYWFAITAIGAAGETSRSEVLRAMAAA